MSDRDGNLGGFARYVVPDVDAIRRAKGSSKRARGVRARRSRLFVKGPIPVDLLGQACRAHPAGTSVLLAVKVASDMAVARGASEWPEIPVTSGLLKPFGVSRYARVRALKALAVVGLLTVRWDGRRAIRARLVRAMWP